jgi:dienelactone hydrolase
LAVVAVASIVAGAHAASRLWKAEQLLERLARVSDAGSADGESRLLTQEITMVSELGPIHARLYRRADAGRTPGIVVAHGVHHQGIDEKRLVAFATALAQAGTTVLTPELRDLADYRITSRTTREIAESVKYFAARTDLLKGEQVGLLGFSFAGGLSLIAAAEPSVGGTLSWVASVGGHHDLARVLRFLAADRVETPSGMVDKQAHEYGLAVLLYGNVEHFVPDGDRELMRNVLRAWLHEDRDRARSLVAGRSSLEAEHLFSLVESQKLRELRPELETLISERGPELRSLSPRGVTERIACPVYLLHGAADSVIPASETQWADRELHSHEHQALVSPLLEHVEVSHEAELKAKLELILFIAKLI